MSDQTDPTPDYVEPPPATPPEAEPTAEAALPTCTGCGAGFRPNESPYTDAGYCGDCGDTCDDCGHICHHDDLYGVGGGRREVRSVCSVCAEDNYDACRDCGERHHTDYTYDVEDYGRICQRCLHSGDYNTCEGCGYVYAPGHTTWREHRDASYCDDCDPGDEEEDEEEQTGPRFIQPYHSTRYLRNPIPSPWTRANRGRYIGVELEVEASGEADRDDIARRLDGVNGYDESRAITADKVARRLVCFEYDGSLSHGFEMITSPMGLDDQRALWAAVIDRTAGQRLRSHNTTTCGLHVHVSRRGLSDVQVAKIVTFVNDPANRPLVEGIARRYSGQYCHVLDKKLRRATAWDDGNRYQAVNLCNPATLEFRIFRGTLKLSSLLACIEFAAAVVAYCEPCGPSGFNLTTAGFLDFIASAAMRRDTRFLRAYIADRLAHRLILPTNFQRAIVGPIPAAPAAATED